MGNKFSVSDAISDYKKDINKVFDILEKIENTKVFSSIKELKDNILDNHLSMEKASNKLSDITKEELDLLQNPSVQRFCISKGISINDEIKNKQIEIENTIDNITFLKKTNETIFNEKTAEMQKIINPDVKKSVERVLNV